MGRRRNAGPMSGNRTAPPSSSTSRVMIGHNRSTATQRPSPSQRTAGESRRPYSPSHAGGQVLIDRASFFLMCRRRILVRYRHASSGFKHIIGRPDIAWAAPD
jgi:hypothetical protein